MKNFTALFLALTIILLFCACGTEEKSGICLSIDESVAKHFEGCMTPDEVIDDISRIDFYHTPDTEGLTEEVVADKENDTEDIHYRDGKGNDVYILFEGYGENGFAHFEKSKSGKDIKVRYFNNDGKRYSVDISCDDYYADFFNINKDDKYGADDIYITIKKPTDKMPQESLCFMYERGVWTVSDTYFFDEEGYKHYWTYFDDDDGNHDLKSFTDTVYTRLDSEPECRSDILTDEMLTIMPCFIFGYHTLSYLDNPSGRWYLTADFVLTFESEETRDAFAEKYNIAESETQGDESEALTLRTGKITVPVSPDCEEFEKIVNTFEVDDPYYKNITLNGKGEIEKTVSTGMYSLY